MSRRTLAGSRAGRTAVLACLAAGLLSTVSTAHATPPEEGRPGGGGPDLTIVTGARVLDEHQVRAHDVTNTAAGQRALAEERSREGGVDVDRRVYRVFEFGEQQWVLPATAQVTVVEGLNAAGEQVFDVAPQAQAAAVTGHAGFASPPTSAFKYNNNSSFATTVGTWKRTVWWTIMKADNWRACSTCTVYDYWRMYGRMQAASLTGASAYEGFKRAWLDFDRTSSTSAIEFEPNMPLESYGGTGTTTTTIGFSTSATISLGAPPVTASLTADNSYTGSIVKSTENWHPVVRSEAGSGGVQWCRYESAEFTGTKYMTTRVNVRHGSTAAGPSWNINTGQQDYTSSCPSQI